LTTTLDGASCGVDNAGNRTSRTPQPSGTASNYTYDPVGNRLTSLGVANYTNNTSNELTSTSNASYSYDYNGNTLTKTDSTGTTNPQTTPGILRTASPA